MALFLGESKDIFDATVKYWQILDTILHLKSSKSVKWTSLTVSCIDSSTFAA